MKISIYKRPGGAFILIFILCVQVNIRQCNTFMQCLWRPEGGVRAPRNGITDSCELPRQGWELRSPLWEVSPVARDTMGVVTEVRGTSAEDSTSFRVLGERMETGWEHRTLCKERQGNGIPFPKRSRSCPSSFLRPLSIKSQPPRFPCREEGTQCL